MTNVIGKWNVLCAASEVGVNTFVDISTDKAANPRSVLGYSKRVTERLTAYTASPAKDVLSAFASAMCSDLVAPYWMPSRDRSQKAVR